MANTGKQRKHSANSTQRRAQAKHAGDKRLKSAKGRNVKARLAELTAELNSQAAELQSAYVIPSQSQKEPEIPQVGDLTMDRLHLFPGGKVGE